MLGNNTLILSKDEMVAAMQYYLDNVLLKSKAKVSGVKETKDSGYGQAGRFEISLAEPEDARSDESADVANS